MSLSAVTDDLSGSQRWTCDPSSSPDLVHRLRPWWAPCSASTTRGNDLQPSNHGRMCGEILGRLGGHTEPRLVQERRTRRWDYLQSVGLCVCVILKAVILATLPLMYFYPRRWHCQISPFVLTPAGLKNGLWHLTAFPAPLNCMYTQSMLTQYTLKCTQTAPDVVETRFFRFTPASDSNASQVSTCDWVSPPCSHCFVFLCEQWTAGCITLGGLSSMVFAGNSFAFTMHHTSS